MTAAQERLMKVISQLKADIAMHTRLLSEATTDEGRAYQQMQIDGCRERLAKREAMLAAEVAKTN